MEVSSLHGYIQLHRKMVSWEWYDDLPTFKLFIHLLFLANHKPTKWRGGTVEKGQVFTGLFKLSEQSNMSIQQVRTALKKLESTGEITTQTTNKYRIITIRNYCKYQDVKQVDQQAVQQASNKQITTSNNVNNDNKKHIRRRFTPPSPDEVKQYFSEKNVNGGEYESFMDHHIARDWVLSNGKKMKDWKAASRTWIKNMSKFNHSPGKPWEKIDQQKDTIG